MRYAIISDIHSNRQALKAVLTDIQGIGAEKIICLGDLVGYGPCPEEVLETAYGRIHHFVLGNHDAVVCGKMSSDLFNDRAKKIIDWTSSVLNEKASRFFKTVPLVLLGNDFRCAHGEFQDPGRFGYIIDESEASESFAACSEKILFAGHSHNPCIFVTGASRVPHLIESQDFTIEDEKRYIVNVGSVGQPRDNDIRASYCIFDSSEKSVIFRKIPFDIDSYCADLKKRKIPESTSYFLGIYRNQPVQPIRDILDFDRVKSEDAVRTAADVKNLEETVKNLKKTVIILVILFLFVGGATAAGIYKYVQRAEKTTEELSAKNIEKEKELTLKESEHQNELVKKENEKQEVLKKYEKTVYIAANAKKPQAVINIKTDEELIVSPEVSSDISSQHPLENWTIKLSDPIRQKVVVEKRPCKGENNSTMEIEVFHIISEVPEDIEIIYLPITVNKGMSFAAKSKFYNEKMEKGGWAGIFIEQELPSGAKKILGQNIPDRLVATNKEWIGNVNFTLKKPVSESGLVRFVIKGQFKGEILVRNCSLKGKK